MKGASRGLEGGLRRVSRGLQGGLRRASRGFEKGFKGASSPSHLRPRPFPRKEPFKPPLKGTFEGGGSDPAPPVQRPQCRFRQCLQGRRGSLTAGETREGGARTFHMV